MGVLDSALSGSPLPDISSTTANITTAPDWYTQLQQNIGTAGQKSMGYDATGKPITGFDPSSMIASESPLAVTARTNAQNVAGSYQPQLTTAEQTAALAAKGVGADQIRSFMSPYTQDVVSNLANMSNLNTQSSVLPALMAASGGSGQFGSSRAANASAGALSNIQAGLTAEQSKALQSGYESALAAAFKNAGLYNESAKVQQGLAGDEQKLGMSGGKYMTDIGAADQAYRQSLIDQPMTAATNAANSLSTLKVPSTTTTTYKGPGQSGQYSTSPLGGITGLAALFASGKDGTSGGEGLLKSFKDFLPSGTDVDSFMKRIFG
jgi:hypothetical protein